MKIKEWTIKDVKKEVKRLDTELKDNDKGFRVAVLLISSLVCGNQIKELVKFTGYSEYFIKETSKNLRKNGIWEGKKIAAHEWFEKDGAIAFWCDVNVGLGYLEKKLVEATK